MNHKYLIWLLRLVISASIVATCIAVGLDIHVTNDEVGVNVMPTQLPISTTGIEDSKEEIKDEIMPSTDEIIPSTEEPEITPVIELKGFHTKMSCDWDAKDPELLVRIAMAEAGDQDVEGKALVMMVILNRMLSDKFPNTIEDVIMQKNQFTPVSSGRFYEVEPDDGCYEALDLIMVHKWDESQGALYFESCSDADNWHSRNLEYLFTHGGHRFYK